jgi:hypothetical protein
MMRVAPGLIALQPGIHAGKTVLYPSLLGSALIDKHLQISKLECLEDASHDFSDGYGRLDEPAAAGGDRR